MKLSNILSGLPLVGSLAGGLDYLHHGKGLTVKTSSGTVHGFVDKSIPNVRQFLGIPFAQAPVNELRWLPPKALKGGASKKFIDATKYPSACPQFEGAAPNIYTRDVREMLPAPNLTLSEDCLHLSVWAPPKHRCEKPLPVFVWIYGGGFQTGATDVPTQLPMNWVQRSQEHIIVSIQYRVNIFGFPNAEGLSSQNLGILDQRLALEWVRDNIAVFGGDTSRITLWGQSAGAASVDFLNLAYPEDPIVSSQICDSGTSLIPLTINDLAHSNFTAVANHFGCTDSSTRLKCMRNVSFQRIEAYLKSYTDARTTPAIQFLPVVDEKVIFGNYSARYEAGQVARVPAIFGTNTDEGVAFAPYPKDPSLPPDQGIVSFLTNKIFLCPAATTTSLRRTAGLPTYRYLYAGNFSDVSPRPWMGAFHGAEMPLLFGTASNQPGRAPQSDLEVRLSHRMQDLWLAFAADPHNAPGWAEVGSGETLVFGADGRIEGRRAVADVDAACA